MPTFSRALRDGYTLQMIVTQVSQNISANTSSVQTHLRIVRPSGQADYTGYTTVWSTSVNGVLDDGTQAGYDFRNYSTLTLAMRTYTIAHNSDGTKSIVVAGAWRETDPDPQVGYTSAVQASGTVTLTTIPRKSNPTMSASAVDAGDQITILTHRASASFTHTIKYKIGSLTGTIATKTTQADVDWNPPLSLLNAIPNSTSGTVTITVETFSGSTSLGSDTTSFTLRAPSEIVPSISSISHSEAVSSVATNVGAYVKNLSKLTMTINGEAGTYGSTIATRKIVVAGQTINADSGTTPNVINASGTVPIVATVTDSRGRSKSLTQNVTVLDYSNPSVSSLTVRRASATGVVQPDGTTIRADIVGSVKSLINSTEKNALTYRIYTRERGTTTWNLVSGPTNPTVTTSGGRLNFSGMVLLNTYAIEDSWDVRVDISDKFVTSSLTGTVATAAIDVHFDANLGVGIGKFRENGRLDVNGDIYSSKIRLSSTGDASISSTGHGLQIGDTAGANMRMDNNEIQAVNNGATSTLNLQLDGGAVALGTTATLRLPSLGDVSVTSTGHPLQLGPDDNLNTAWDSNEMQARNNGAASSFGINSGGGDVTLGSSASTINLAGRLNATHLPWAESAGTVSVASSGVTNVTFPSGRFNRTPRVVATPVNNGTVGIAFITGLDATGFEARFYAYNGTQMAGTIHWHAVQMSSGNASG